MRVIDKGELEALVFVQKYPLLALSGHRVPTSAGRLHRWAFDLSINIADLVYLRAIWIVMTPESGFAAFQAFVGREYRII